ncbi:PepSY domain-containing protein [Caulobacter segnis]|uniref:PepSY domain-containing protein n=1 Tax=Caulobacter segnis TaxID=88688 RepID=UPI002410A7FA|nr:PepSY domain-containing protein [Caulobacter segnis]MDG2523297.1 PepSY domain-containing protein [Caulobacter segnis]
MTRFAAIFAAALVAVTLPVAAEAQGRRQDSLGADWRPRQDEARSGAREGRLVPLERVIQNIARRVPGRPLDAGLEGQYYRVRWATEDGRRIDFIVDATSGQIVSGN